MHVLIGKRQLILAGLVVMLGLAVFVNWYYTGDKTPMDPEGTAAAEGTSRADGAASFASAEAEAEYFAALKLERSAALSASLEELQAVAASASISEDQKQTVGNQIASLTERSRMENDIESLVTAQVGGNCVAVIGNGGVDVIISPDRLNDASVLAISDIVQTVSGGAFEDVRIAAAKG